LWYCFRSLSDWVNRFSHLLIETHKLVRHFHRSDVLNAPFTNS
jgi:hypothetical protein